MKIKTNFRLWLELKYYEYKDEVLAWEKTATTKDLRQYVLANRWFLKKLYQSEQVSNDISD